MAGFSNQQSKWVEQALERYERPLVQYAMRLTGDLETARDVVQDTFLRLCRSPQGKLNGRLAPWLYTVCRNRALDIRKKEAPKSPLSTEQAEARPSPDAGPSALASSRETHQLVLDALAELPELEREVFRLKFQDGLSYREISEIIGKSLGTVSNLMGSALNSIRKQLKTETDLVAEGSYDD